MRGLWGHLAAPVPFAPVVFRSPQMSGGIHVRVGIAMPLVPGRNGGARWRRRRRRCQDMWRAAAGSVVWLQTAVRARCGMNGLNLFVGDAATLIF